MASIRIDLNVTSNGSIARESTAAKELANELERAARAAELYNRQAARAGAAGPGPSAGGPPPPPRPPAGGGGGGTPPGPGGTPPGGPGSTPGGGYRQFQGITGSGAAGRDFGKEASGLGGLVHVYATFAANIYAIGAAFSALSKAADTTNMIKGLDQLGASAGRNLGGLAKQMVLATDGAISLKDAMVATAQASAGGMGGDQLLRLTEVAKKASQALGRDMPDALSRLTRGITKIEPELLDELGIMVKVDKANIDYARSLGKTASSLSDLEKRQAFANAVITQGEQKFRDIEMGANPYAKIAASIENLSHSGLELVNKVLGPVIGLLANSPTALMVTIGAIASMLLKQAIPALGQWRDGLKHAADASRAASIKINEDFKKFKESRLSINQPLLAQQLAQQEAAIGASMQRLTQAANASGRRLTSSMRSIIATPVSSISQAQMEGLAREEAAARSRSAKLAAEAADPQRAPSSQASKLVQSQERLAQAENIKQYTAGIQGARTAEAALAADRLRIQEEMNRRQAAYTEGGQRQRVADRAERIAVRNEILSNVGQNTQTMGMSGAMTRLKEETKAARVEAQNAGKTWTGLASANTMVRGSFAIATSAVSGFLGAFGPWMAVIGLVIAGLGALINWLGTNTKEVAEFSNAVDGLTSNIDLVNKVLDVINKKPLLAQLSIETIQAKSNAMTELSNSISKVTDTLYKADKNASGFDKFIDGIKTIWGGDLRSKATKSISDSIIAALKLADGATKAQLEDNLKDLLDTTDFTSKGLAKAINEIPVEQLTSKFEQVVEKVGIATKAMSTHSTTLTSMKGDLDTASKAAQTLAASLNPSDPLTTFANTLLISSASITNSLLNPIDSLLTLQTIMEDVGRLSLLPKDTAGHLIKESEAIKQVQLDYASAKAGIKAYTEAIAVNNALQAKKQLTNKEGSSISGEFNTTSKDATRLKNKDEIANNNIVLHNVLDSQKIAFKKAEDNIKSFGGLIKEVADTSLASALTIMDIARKNSESQNALTITKASVAGISGPGTANISAEIRTKEFEIRQSQIDVSRGVVTSQSENTSAIEQLTNQLKINAAIEETNRATKTLDSARAMPDIPNGSGYSLKDETIRLAELALIRKQNTENELKQTTVLSSAIQELLSKPVSIMKKALNDLRGDASPKAAVERSALTRQIISTSAVEDAQAKLNADEKASLLTQAAELSKETLQTDKESLDLKTKSNDSEYKLLGLAQSTTDVYIESFQTRKEDLRAKNRSIEGSKIELEYAKKIEAANRVVGVNSGGLKIQAQKEFYAALAALAHKRNEELAADSMERIRLELAEEDRVLAIRQKIADSTDAIAKSQLEYSRADLSARQSLSNISAESYINEAAALEIKNIQLDKEITLRKSQEAYDSNVSKVTKTATTDIQSSTNPLIQIRLAEALILKLDEMKAVQDAITKSTEDTNDAKEKMAELNKKTNLELEKQNKLTKLMEGIANSLTKAFGKVGTSIGSIAKTFKTSAESIVQIEKKKNRDIDALAKDGPPDPKEQAKIEQKYALETGSVVMGAAADTADAVADSFDQQSGAAKAFHMMSKIFHVAKLAMDVASVVSAIATAGIQETLSKSVALSWIPAIWGQAFGTAGPFMGWALGAAAVAMVVGASGGGSAPAAGGTSAEKQKVQGTGQKYDSSGNIVDTGGGVLGDSSAKSESIAHSIELIAKYTNSELEYSNKMLDALQSIERSLVGVSKSMILTSGITSGTAFGTKEGAGGGGFLSSVFGGATETSIVASGFRIAGSVDQLTQQLGTMEQYQTTRTTESGGWFGSDETTDKIDVKGLGSVAKAAIATSVLNAKNAIVSVGEELFKATGDISLSAGVLVKKVGELPFDLEVDLRGLKGKEISDAIQTVFSAKLDEISAAVLSSIVKYAIPNEAALETAVRVATSFKTVGAQLDSIGMVLGTGGIGKLVTVVEDVTTKVADAVKYEQYLTFDEEKGLTLKDSGQAMPQTYTETTTKVTKQVATNAVDATMALVNLAGGLDEFKSLTETYKDNFLTDAEKLAPVQKAVSNRFKELNTEFPGLGIGAITTNEQFKSLVGSLDTSTEAGGKLFIDLMKVSVGFFKVTKSIEDLKLAYESNFFTESEQLIPKQAKLTSSMAALNKQFPGLGISAIATKDQFKALVTSLTAAGLEGGELWNKLMDVQDAFSSVANTIDSLKTTYEDSFLTDAEKHVQSQAKVTSSMEDLNKQFPGLGISAITTNEQFNTLVNTLVATGQMGSELWVKLMGVSTGFAAVTSSIEGLRSAYEGNFLTEAERLVPIQAKVTSSMESLNKQFPGLGISAITTKGQFKTLVDTLEATGQSGGVLWTGLMGVQDKFNTVATAAENLAENKLTQLAKAMELLDYKSGSNAITRAKEMKGLDKESKAIQVWIYALEDEATARDNLKTAYKEESAERKTSIDNLKASIKTLKEFKTSLILGAMSPLTPGQKYAQAKSELKAITDVLDNTGASKEDTKDALEKLPNAISSFLDTSKIFNASSTQYQNDFSYTQKLLTTTTDGLIDQLSVQEEELAEMKKQVGLLGGIETATLKVVDAIAALKLATSTTKAAEGAVPADFLTSATSDTAFVKGLYQTTQGITNRDDTAGQAYWVDRLDKGDTRETVKSNIELNAKTAIVSSWYNTHPDAEKAPKAEDVAYWVSKITPSYTSSQVKEDFTTSVAAHTHKPKVPIVDFYAKGGMAPMGLAVVGEQGPELVNFNNPGMVSTAGQTQNIFDNFGAAMAKEVRELRLEVAKLREEQKNYTGMLIQSNFDANNIAADKVAVAVADTASITQWNNTRNVARAF